MRNRFSKHFLLFVFVCLINFPCFAAEKDTKAQNLETALKQAHIKTDTAALVDYLKQQIPSTTTVESWKKDILALGTTGRKSYAIRNAASTRLCAASPAVVPLLTKALRNQDIEIRHRASECIEVHNKRNFPPVSDVIHLLAHRKVTSALELSVDSLPYVGSYQQDHILESIKQLCRNDNALEKKIRAFASSPLAYRRMVAGHVLGSSHNVEKRKLVYPLLEDISSRVRLKTALGIIQSRDKKAISPLIALLTSASSLYLWEIEYSLRAATQVKRAELTLESAYIAHRKKTQQAWKQWWKENKVSTRLHSFAPKRGLLMVSGYDDDWVGIMAPSGRFLWKISDVDYPNTAQFLPNGRVLVAERNGKRVTERDLTGKTHWFYEIGDGVTGSQRLPNGNTLIVGWEKILEVKRDKRVVRQLPGSFRHAQVHENGHLLLVSHTGLIQEYDKEWKLVRKIKTPNEGNGAGYWASVYPLTKNRFLISLGGVGKVYEIDQKGKIFWEQNAEDPVFATRLINGNTLITCFEEKYATEVDRTGKEVRRYEFSSRVFNVHPF